MPLRAVAADSWTPYAGTVVNTTDFGVFVDFGSERPGLLPRRGSNAVDGGALDSMRIGDIVTVYVKSRQRDTGKVNLSLEPLPRPRRRLQDILADGRTAYEGCVANVSKFGTFVDIGTEMQGLIPHAEGDGPGLAIGDEVKVYVTEKRKDHGKIVLSLEPEVRRRRGSVDVEADGRTPHRGVVQAVVPGMGVLFDIGLETNALLPIGDGSADAEQASAFRVGEEVVLYVVRFVHSTGRVTVSLRARTLPLRPFGDFVADGQTQIDGVVDGKADYGAFVDIGCSSLGFLPARDVDPKVWEELKVGSPVSVYVVSKARDTQKITLSMRRASRPRERWEAIVCDGQTPYEGRVISSGWFGVFVDIGAECHGRLSNAHCGDERTAALTPGDSVTVYVIEKRPDSGKLMLSLDRRDRRLLKVKELISDGQTPYNGVVTSVSAMGAWVDMGGERLGLVSRRGVARESEDDLAALGLELDSLTPGTKILTYVFRRNLFNGRVLCGLHPSAVRRLTVEDALRDPAATFLGRVYALDYKSIFLEFGCEAGGVLPRNAAPPGLADGHEVLVHAVSFDAATGRMHLTRARPPAPPRP